MFKLSLEELQNAYEAIEHHGFSALLPEPPEWADIRGHWADIRQLLAEEDLDTYMPIKTLKAFAPKTRYTVRVVTHLHPQDLIIYTALVLIIRADIERSRIPVADSRVFSYRSDINVQNQLYQAKDSFTAYKRELGERSSKATCRYVSVADIELLPVRWTGLAVV